MLACGFHCSFGGTCTGSVSTRCPLFWTPGPARKTPSNNGDFPTAESGKAISSTPIRLGFCSQTRFWLRSAARLAGPADALGRPAKSARLVRFSLKDIKVSRRRCHTGGTARWSNSLHQDGLRRSAPPFGGTRHLPRSARALTSRLEPLSTCFALATARMPRLRLSRKLRSPFFRRNPQ